LIIFQRRNTSVSSNTPSLIHQAASLINCEQSGKCSSTSTFRIPFVTCRKVLMLSAVYVLSSLESFTSPCEQSDQFESMDSHSLSFVCSSFFILVTLISGPIFQIGRASCRERV